VTGGTAEGGRRENEEADTDRRALLRLGGLTVAAATAAEISRLIAIADADPLAVDSFEAGIQRIATTYTVTAHPDLAPQVEAGWLATERMLDTRIPAAVRTRVTRLAGQYSFYLGLLAFDLGDDAAAQRFLTLSARHAEEVGDLLTTGSVAAIRSSVAFFTGRYDEAADLAAAARPHSHPYTRPILAGCEARGAARAGRPEAATLAVADMTAHVWDGEVLPGPNKGGEQFAHGFRARVFADLGDGERAEPHARASLALLEGTGHYVQLGGSRNSLGRALLRRERPEPEQAAAAVADAVRALGGRPNRGVLDAGEELWQAMNARWPHLPAVRDLGEMLKLARRALPGSRSAADL
jgi:hypothetical protein